MRKIFLLVTRYILLVMYYSLCVTCCYARPISSMALIEDAKYYDGKDVEFEGEIVGDILGSGEYVWINLFDRYNAIGVWIQKKKISNIKYKGNYNFKGDIIRVKGRFNRACKMHWADFDIHADSIEIIKSGRLTAHKVNKSKLNLVIICSILALIVFIIELLTRMGFRSNAR